jgi:hypothetical protein
MLKRDNMQKVAMGVLAVMLVASLLLAVASFVWLPSAQAAPPRPLTYCWEEEGSPWCYDHAIWQCTYYYCCNHPDLCPQGCCLVSFWCDCLCYNCC